MMSNMKGKKCETRRRERRGGGWRIRSKWENTRTCRDDDRVVLLCKVCRVICHSLRCRVVEGFEGVLV